MKRIFTIQKDLLVLILLLFFAIGCLLLDHFLAQKIVSNGLLGLALLLTLFQLKKMNLKL